MLVANVRNGIRCLTCLSPCLFIQVIVGYRFTNSTMPRVLLGLVHRD